MIDQEQARVASTEATRGVALAWLLASRRDALLLLLLAGGALAWSWDRGAGATGVGALVSAVVFVLLLGLVRQARAAHHLLLGSEQPSIAAVGALVDVRWSTWLLGLSGLATTGMVAHAAWQLLNSRPLVGLVALLALCWQVWLYFWTATPPEVLEEEG